MIHYSHTSQTGYMTGFAHLLTQEISIDALTSILSLDKKTCLITDKTGGVVVAIQASKDQILAQSAIIE